MPITTPICMGVAMGMTKNPPLFKSLDPALESYAIENINRRCFCTSGGKKRNKNKYSVYQILMHNLVLVIKLIA